MFYRIFISFVFLFVLGGPSLSAQRVLKDVKLLLKQKKANEALNRVRALETDSVARSYPQLYDYGVQAYMKLNDALNEKAYLRQPYDTAQFFRTIYGIYNYALKCDSVERKFMAEGKKCTHFQKEHTVILHNYYQNLSVGGRYFFRKQNYKDAILLLKTAVDVPQSSLWGSDEAILKSSDYIQTAGILQRAAFLRNEYPLALHYAPLALKDTTKMRAGILKTTAEAYAAMGDSVSYLQYIKEGLNSYPRDEFFFTELSDYYTGHGDYESSCHLADSLLNNVDSLNVYFLTAKSLALMNLGKNRQAIVFSLMTLRQDSTIIDAYYYVGAAFCNLANEIELPTSINSKAYKEALKKRQNYYLAARPYLETYRKKAPNKLNLWGPLLYRLYMVLNQGKQFEEIQRLLNKK